VKKGEIFMTDKITKANNNKPDVVSIIICVVFAIGGAFCLKAAIDTLTENASLVNTCTEKASGTVSGYNKTGSVQEERNSDGRYETVDSRKDYPIYEFEVDGHLYAVQSERPDLKGDWRHRIGDEVTVLYAPGDPQIASVPGSILGPLGFFAAGGVLFVVCGLGLYSMTSKGKKKKDKTV
jgi:hypothetical protein